MSTPVIRPDAGDDSSVAVSGSPDYYYVVVLAGQSNGMTYGEGLPLPDSFDRPDPRIKQLARRSTVTPGGTTCKYNDIIPADHCLHDVQDMSGINHPKADLNKGQYGCVSQGLHIAKNCCLISRRMPGYFWCPVAVAAEKSVPVSQQSQSPRPSRNHISQRENHDRNENWSLLMQ